MDFCGIANFSKSSIYGSPIAQILRISQNAGRHTSHEIMETPLRTLRKARGLTLKAVAEAIGSDTGNLSHFERRTRYPSREMAATLVQFFGPPLDELQLMYPERYMGADAVAGALARE